MDASAIVAILAREEDWQTHADHVDAEHELLWSPVAKWESVFGLRRQREFQIERAKLEIDEFAAEIGLKMVTIGAVEAEMAIDAAIRYGRGSGHRAGLNMGDCFAYACAKANNARLLYKGDDFAHTDLA